MNSRNIFLLSIIGFWVILSERITLESIIFALLICIFVFMMNNEKGSSEKNYSYTKNIVKYGFYVYLLVKEILISNIQVARVVLSPKILISPTIITHETKLKSQFLRTVFANSITLTPGTLTVSMDNNILKIHCLREEYAKNIINSEIERILLEIEG